MGIDTRENLTNYIMSVQSLVDRINMMQTNKNIDFDYINTRIDVLQTYEDKILLELSSIK